MNFNNTTFIKSIERYEQAPGNKLPEVLLCGKSNVGKSSLVNALCGRVSLAYTSSKPGHTKLLNYFLVDNSFYLVDAPGYGYAKGGIDLDKLFKNLMDDYFSNSKSLKLVLLLFNSERTLNDNDEELLSYLISHHIPFKVVFTKIDKLNQKEKSALLKYISELGISDNYLFVSTSNKKLIANLQATIEKHL